MIKWDRRGLMGAIMGNRMEMKTRIGVVLTNLEFLEFQWIWVKGIMKFQLQSDFQTMKFQI